MERGDGDGSDEGWSRGRGELSIELFDEVGREGGGGKEGPVDVERHYKGPDQTSKGVSGIFAYSGSYAISASLLAICASAKAGSPREGEVSALSSRMKKRRSNVN